MPGGRENTIRLPMPKTSPSFARVQHDQAGALEEVFRRAPQRDSGAGIRSPARWNPDAVDLERFNGKGGPEVSRPQGQGIGREAGLRAPGTACSRRGSGGEGNPY